MFLSVPFGIDGESGVVSVVGSVDNLKEVYHLEVVATDRQETIMAPLTIRLGLSQLKDNQTLQFTVKENIQGTGFFLNVY